MTKLFAVSNAVAALLALMLMLLGWLSGCKPAESPVAAEQAPASEESIDLLFSYGSEKEDWIRTVTADFNRKRVTMPSGKIVQVNADPMGYGECIDTILNGQMQPHLSSRGSALPLSMST